MPSAAPTATPGVCATATPLPSGGVPVEWSTYGGSQERTFFNARETRITRATVGSLRPKWRYQTAAVVTASPSVAYVDVPGEGRIKVVIAASWDGNVYALRAANGTRLWSFPMKPHPGGSFPYASSAAVAMVDGEQRVYVGGGMTMYCLAAATGELRWAFDAGTGCTTCDRRTERNEIEASPAVVDGMVIFGMDVNDSRPGKGGAYAVDAAAGTLVWYFDLETQATCRPDPGDAVRRFDGFHTAAELGLAEDFFATREGCDFDRSWTECGNIWSSFAVDPQRRALYVASSNCETDDDPATFPPPPPMPPFDEAIFALDYDGVPLWRWRPREVDNDDLAFGGVPNLFTTVIDGAEREVVGVGNKDGTYYLLDRDGENELTGVVEPYWQTKVVPGGAIGGIIASAAVGEGKVQFSTAIGLSLSNPQRPAAWGLRAGDGDVIWSNAEADPSYAPTSAIPGVAFMGSLLGRFVAYDSDSGEALYRSPALGGPVASAAAVVDGELFIGVGVGQRGNPQDIAHLQSLIPSPIMAFCLADACDCPAQLCDDGDPCTFDYHDEEGACATEPAPDGIRCTVGEEQGACQTGVCAL
jgi:polyvinyl alcohol dehydrogenase (cytochrome)